MVRMLSGILMLVRLVHSLNASLPITLKCSGNVIVSNATHPLKVPFNSFKLLPSVTFANFVFPLNWLFRVVRPFPMISVVRLSHPSNTWYCQVPPTLVTPFPILTVSNAVHPLNVPPSMVDKSSGSSIFFKLEQP